MFGAVPHPQVVALVEVIEGLLAIDVRLGAFPEIARHPLPAISAEISAPPRICPTTAPLESAIAYRPIARARWSPEKFS